MVAAIIIRLFLPFFRICHQDCPEMWEHLEVELRDAQQDSGIRGVIKVCWTALLHEWYVMLFVGGMLGTVLILALWWESYGPPIVGELPLLYALVWESTLWIPTFMGPMALGLVLLDDYGVSTLRNPKYLQMTLGAVLLSAMIWEILFVLFLGVANFDRILNSAVWYLAHLAVLYAILYGLHPQGKIFQKLIPSAGIGLLIIFIFVAILHWLPTDESYWYDIITSIGLRIAILMAYICFFEIRLDLFKEARM